MQYLTIINVPKLSELLPRTFVEASKQSFQQYFEFGKLPLLKKQFAKRLQFHFLELFKLLVNLQFKKTFIIGKNISKNI